MITKTQTPNPAGDDVDRLLTAFYRAEMPAAWPAAPRPWAESPRPTAGPRRNPANRSRWALAASIALLIGGCWYLSGQVTDGKRPRPGLDDGTANPPKILKDHMGEPKPAPMPEMP